MDEQIGATLTVVDLGDGQVPQTALGIHGALVGVGVVGRDGRVAVVRSTDRLPGGGTEPGTVRPLDRDTQGWGR